MNETLTNLKDFLPNGTIQMYRFRLEANVVFSEDSYHADFIVHATDQQQNQILATNIVEFY